MQKIIKRTKKFTKEDLIELCLMSIRMYQKHLLKGRVVPLTIDELDALVNDITKQFIETR